MPRASKPRRPAPAVIAVRQVEAFDKAALDALTGPIFGDAARRDHLDELIGPELAARNAALRDGLPQPERIRIAAFAGTALVGVSSGWFEPGGNFYIGLSAVEPTHRRRGIYSRLLQTMEAAVRERGAIVITSQHVASNNAVLIAKLKLGYVIAGTEYVEPMGLLVRLVQHLAPERRALFVERTGRASARVGSVARSGITRQVNHAGEQRACRGGATARTTRSNGGAQAPDSGRR
jgi:ribosomal protein S18 acetylase RimI-like enzyme